MVIVSRASVCDSFYSAMVINQAVKQTRCKHKSRRSCAHRSAASSEARARYHNDVPLRYRG